MMNFKRMIRNEVMDMLQVNVHNLINKKTGIININHIKYFRWRNSKNQNLEPLRPF